jgi:hypothetical protein
LLQIRNLYTIWKGFSEFGTVAARKSVGKEQGRLFVRRMATLCVSLAGMCTFVDAIAAGAIDVKRVRVQNA